MEKTIDILCVGEVLIDLIGHEINASINKTKNYHRFLGGSPTNVAVNAARLGLKSALVATCGQDGFGDFIVRKLNSSKVITSQIKQLENVPTTVIFVSKSTNTPEFIPYRQADFQINQDQISNELLSTIKIFHTTCFALSKNPAQSTILESAKRAKLLGVKTSIDINYSNKIWPNTTEALTVIKVYLSTNPLVKVSEDDCYRLFGETKTDSYIFDHFHTLGASTVCLTKGGKGVTLSDKSQGVYHQNALPLIEIQDATGAGDAFWTGFLYAQLQNKNFEDTITIAQKMAILKLQNIGKLPDEINIHDYLNVD